MMDKIKFDSRGDQIAARNGLDRNRVHSEGKLERTTFDAELAKDQIKAMHSDGTAEDAQRTHEYIVEVQIRIRRHFQEVFCESEDVTRQMTEFSSDAHSAAERAREDQKRMERTYDQLQNPQEYGHTIETIIKQKHGSSQFQGDQGASMDKSMSALERIKERTKQRTQNALDAIG